MKRWMGLTLLISAATATGAAAQGPGGWCYGGPPHRSHHGNRIDFRLGFGSRFGARGYYTPYWSMPAYGWGGFPGYAGFSGLAYSPGFAGFGYGYGYPFLSYSPTDAFLPFWNNAVGVSRFGLPQSIYGGGSNTVELPPRVVVIDNSAGPRLTDGSARLDRDGERFYLDPRAAEAIRERPATVRDTLRESIRIEKADTDQYLVRWTGDPSELAALEVTALDADRKVVMRRLIKAAPFRGLLNTGGKTTLVTVSFDLKDGPTVTLEYPLERFQGLAE